MFKNTFRRYVDENVHMTVFVLFAGVIALCAWGIDVPGTLFPSLKGEVVAEASSGVTNTETPREVEDAAKEILERGRTQSDTAAIFAEYIEEYNPRVFPELAAIIANSIESVGEEYGIPPVFLLALAQVESSFNYMAVSKAKCIGLLQINPSVWVLDASNEHSLKKSGIVQTRQSLFDPLTNIRAGAHIFSLYYRKAIDSGATSAIKSTLTRYFGGQTNNHYAKFEAALGSFYMYLQTKNGMEGNSLYEISAAKGLPECVTN